MPFPPPKAKPSVKQWAGGPKPPPPGPPAPPGAPPGAEPGDEDPQEQHADPAAPPAAQPAPGTPPQQPGVVADGDPKMMSRAHQAMARLLMEGGLTPEVDALLMQAMTKMVEHKKGGALPKPPGEEEQPGAGEEEESFPPKDDAVEDPADPTAKPPFPSKPGAAPSGPPKPGFGKPAFPPKKKPPFSPR